MKNNATEYTNFYGRLEQMDRDGIRKQILSLQAPCYESRLLKTAFPDLDVFDTSALTLYQSHFLLFHLLFQLQDEWYSQEKYLHVHFMHIFLHELPPTGRCRFFADPPRQFCRAACLSEQTFCDFHRTLTGDDQLNTLSIKYFYLDPENFDALDEKAAEAFIEGAWDLLAHYPAYEESLKVLGVSASADIQTIKKRFRRLAMKHHPDHADGHQETFLKINRAYQLLLRLNPLQGR